MSQSSLWLQCEVTQHASWHCIRIMVDLGGRRQISVDVVHLLLHVMCLGNRSDGCLRVTNSHSSTIASSLNPLFNISSASSSTSSFTFLEQAPARECQRLQSDFGKRTAGASEPQYDAPCAKVPLLNHVKDTPGCARDHVNSSLYITSMWPCCYASWYHVLHRFLRENLQSTDVI
eukprot:2150526-Amphidinium_carterae.1